MGDEDCLLGTCISPEVMLEIDLFTGGSSNGYPIESGFRICLLPSLRLRCTRGPLMLDVVTFDDADCIERIDARDGDALRSKLLRFESTNPDTFVVLTMRPDRDRSDNVSGCEE